MLGVDRQRNGVLVSTMHVHSMQYAAQSEDVPKGPAPRTLPCLTLKTWATTTGQSRGRDQVDLEQDLACFWSLFVFQRQKSLVLIGHQGLRALGDWPGCQRVLGGLQCTQSPQNCAEEKTAGGPWMYQVALPCPAGSWMPLTLGPGVNPCGTDILRYVL